jgi:hypothetical protein
VQGGAAKVLSMLLEVGGGSLRRDGAGEVLQAPLQGAGQDDPPVLRGERVWERGETLQFGFDVGALAGKVFVYKLGSPDGGASDDEPVLCVTDSQLGSRRSSHVVVGAVHGALSGNWGEAQSAHLCGECIEGLDGG